MVPGLRAVLRQLTAMRGAGDPAARAGLLVIAMEIDLPMQSHPVRWLGAADGRLSPERQRAIGPWTVGGAVGKRPGPRGDAPVITLRDGAAARHGILGVAGAGARPGAETGTGIPTEAGTGTGNAPADGADAHADEALCGVLLCCVTASSPYHAGGSITPATANTTPRHRGRGLSGAPAVWAGAGRLPAAGAGAGEEAPRLGAGARKRRGSPRPPA